MFQFSQFDPVNGNGVEVVPDLCSLLPFSFAFASDSFVVACIPICVKRDLAEPSS
jgi:hypothetical protein